MSQAQLVQMDFAEADATAKLLPRSPLLSSHSLGWDGILVQHHQQPAWEMPEYTPSHHTLTLQHHSHTVASERVLNGKLRTEQLQAGDVALIPVDVAHKKLWRRDCNFTLLMLDPVHVARITSEVTDNSQFELLPQFAKSDPLIYQIGIALKSELETDRPSDRLYIDSLMTALIAHLMRHYSTVPLVTSPPINGLSKYQLERTIEYINAHLTQELNLSELADAVGVSKFYFCRLFKQSMGSTPHQYVIEQRVERAKQLLQQRQFAIADVALQCGFANQSHLNRHFKRIVGITPFAFLKQ